MDGDPTTGFLVGETQTFPDGVHYDQYRIGGTSLSAPLFSGLMAVANQLDRFDHGFVNPVLYHDHLPHGGDRPTCGTWPAARSSGDCTSTASTPAAGSPRSVRTFDFQGLTIHTALPGTTT